jgi:hypothetical protein
MIRFNQRDRRGRNFGGGARRAAVFGGLACLMVTVAAGPDLTAAEQSIARDVATAEQLALDQAGLTCGRDCLYIWLRLQGNAVSYDDVQSRVAVGPQGSEMSEILKASRAWEPSARLGKLTYRELCALKCPVIVHIWVTQGKNREGHYMVVTEATENHVSLIETATQIRSNMRPQEFSEIWSSYALYKETPVMNWDIMALSSLPVIAVLLIVNGLRQSYSHMKAKRLAMGTAAVGLSVLLAGSGCSRSSPEAVDIRNVGEFNGSDPGRKVDVMPIAASKRHVDLGIVPFDKSGTATFSITNLKNEPVELQLGQPSCGCTKAVLSEETVGPRKTVTLEISLGAEGGAYSGPRQGSVELGVQGSAGSLIFSVEGILEGMSLFPYTLRVATEETESNAPGPLEGEITLGPSRSAEPVSIEDVTMPAREEAGLAIGQATFRPGVEINGYMRRSFEIPISVRAGIRPKPGVYPIRITVKVGDQAVEGTAKVFVVPAMQD